MNTIYNFIPQELTNAIGWTIFHSLWQGVLISVLLGVVLLISGKKSAILRYNFSMAALIVTFLLSTATFIQVYDSSYKDTYTSNRSISSSIFTDPLSSQYDNVIKTDSDRDVIGALENYFAQHLNFIVTVWLAGFIIFSIRFGGGLIYVQKLRSSGTNAINDDYWFARLKELSESLQLKQLIKIYESVRVKTPITIGYLKPIILIPVGMLSGLPQDQAEAIILHELAHIKRFDFLLNLLQTVIETIFFYHPAVWWISSVIKSERENCCDDLTLKLCSGSLVYFKALYNLQQICSEEKEIVLAAIGKKNQLFRRINRMNSNNKNVQYGAKFTVFAVMLVLFAAASIYSTSATGGEKKTNFLTASFTNPFSVDIPSVPSVPDAPPIPDTTSLKKGKRTLKFDDGDTRYKAKLNNGKLEELFINGDKVDQKDLSKYDDKVAEHVDEYDSAMNDFHVKMAQFQNQMKVFKEKMRKFRGNNYFYFDSSYAPFVYKNNHFLSGKDSSDLHKILKKYQHGIQEGFANHSFNIPPVPPINIPPIHIPPININIPKIDWDSTWDCNNYNFNNEEFKELMRDWNKSYKKEVEKFKEEMKNYKFDMEKYNEDMSNFKNEMKKYSEEMKKNGPGSESFKKSMEELKSNLAGLKEKLKPIKEFTSEMKHELVKDNVIENIEDIDNLRLSQKEMTVNGKKLSEDLHKKYLELYKKHFGEELSGNHAFRLNY
jgi:bla regulator protein blaR1